MGDSFGDGSGGFEDFEAHGNVETRTGLEHLGNGDEEDAGIGFAQEIYKVKRVLKRLSTSDSVAAESEPSTL